VIAAEGKLGAFDRVEAWVRRVLEAPDDAPLGPRLACSSMTALALIMGGRYLAADALLETIGGAASDPGRDPQSTALLEQTRAYRAVYKGDAVASLASFTAALGAFEETGDRRNACNIRSNLGFILAELGDFPGAEEALRGALADADRMGLHDVALAAVHNLGPVVAQSGRLEEARALELRAAEAFERQGDRRVGGVARSYLAKIALLAGDTAAAEREARAAAEALRIAPPLRAAALANLARALLAQGRSAEALPVAREAFATLEELGMIEEGESLVRLVHAEALVAAGRAEEFETAIADARDRLLARAAKISDPEWRHRFLTAVPDNARTLRLAQPAEPG
jgi:tetratricopeptide (TPR) repeat protein